MKLSDVNVAHVALLNPDEEGGEYSFVVRVELQMKHGDEPVGFGIKIVADVPYETSLTFDEIAKRGIIRAREMLGLAASTGEDAWLEMHKQSLEPPKPFTFDPT